MLCELNEAGLLYVADNMREIDKKEVFATRWDDNPEDLVDCIMAKGSFGWISVANDGIPVAAFGAIACWPGVWQVWMFATDRWDEVSSEVTKFIKRIMIPAIKSTDWLRAECRSIEGHDTAHRWLEFLGATREASLKMLGKNGDTFHVYSWTNDKTNIN
jgi:hypothetical protein